MASSLDVVFRSDLYHGRARSRCWSGHYCAISRVAWAPSQSDALVLQGSKLLYLEWDAIGEILEANGNRILDTDC